MKHITRTLNALTLLTLVGSARAANEPAPQTDSGRTIVKEVIVDAPRAEVWTAWTTAEGITTFFGAAANIELRHRGPFEVFFDLNQPEGLMGADGCEVLSWLHEEMISFTWNAPPQFRDVRMQRSFIVVQLFDVPDESGAPGRTRVKLTQGGFGEGEQWDQVYEYFDNAWGYVTQALVERYRDGADVRQGKAHTPDPSRHYIYFLRPADEDLLSRTEFTDAERQAFAGHIEYLRDLLATDKLILAGPCADPAQMPDSSESMVPLGIPAVGLVVFRARDDAEAKAVMEADPAVAAGIFRAQVNPMNLAHIRP
jgi:uncharacterized protein YndB with AHSA1/START domain/uncharacterized protein YciI